MSKHSLRIYKKIIVNDKLKSPNTDEEYVGMNLYAARTLGIDFPWQSHTIPIWKGLSPKARKNTFDHEVVEAEKMRKGKRYEKAHKESPHTEPLSEKTKEVASEYEKADFSWEG